MNTGANNRRKYQISIIHSIYQITNKDPITNAQTSGTSCSMDWHEYISFSYIYNLSKKAGPKWMGNYEFIWVNDISISYYDIFASLVWKYQ